MSVLSIIELLPNNLFIKGSCLREKANDVKQTELKEAWLKQLVQDMFETLYSRPSGVGLAANQVGVLKRIITIDIKRDASKPLVLINPSYEPLSNEMADSKEICLCVPRRMALVKRYKQVKVKYMNFQGDVCEILGEGFKSYVYQHEVDHLNGIVYIDLVKDAGNLIEYPGYEVDMAVKALENISDLN